jgi:hypothetical protein
MADTGSTELIGGLIDKCAFIIDIARRCLDFFQPRCRLTLFNQRIDFSANSPSGQCKTQANAKNEGGEQKPLLHAYLSVPVFFIVVGRAYSTALYTEGEKR